MKQDKQQELTIYDYEQKYVKRENAKGVKFAARILAFLIYIFAFAVLFFITKEVYQLYDVAGLIVGVICVILYISFIIIPVCKVFKSDYFETNVNKALAPKAIKHNRIVRRNIAKKIIDMNERVTSIKWYDEALVGKLAISVTNHNDKQIKNNLTLLYNDSIKATAKEMIFKSSVKSAMFSSISQQSTIDVALVTATNIQMIKDIVFLYGFRPSDAKLAKIFSTVIMNSLVSYGLGNSNIGNAVVKSIGGATKSIPILGSLLETIIDSSIQGITNATFTAVIGHQTIKYLEKEYNLQNLLDEVVLSTDEDLKDTCLQVEKELKKAKK